jgi:hypothetical protein
MCNLVSKSVLMAVLAAGMAFAQAESIPLGDVVKQPKPAKKAARVITDDNFVRAAQVEPAAATSEKSNSPVNGESEAELEGKNAAAEAPKNKLLAQRISDLRDAEALEEQVIKKLEGKLGDETEPLNAHERQTYSNALKQSQATLESYRKQRKLLEDIQLKADNEQGEQAEAKVASVPDANVPPKQDSKTEKAKAQGATTEE